MCTIPILRSAQIALDQIAAGPQGPPGQQGLNGLNAPGAVARVDTLYVGKHGDNTNTGATPDSAVLTISDAISKANALADGSNRVRIEVLDGGTYTEGNMTFDDGIHLYAPDATLIGRIVIRDDTRITAHRIYNENNGFPTINKNSGTSLAVVHINEIDGRGTSGTLTGKQLVRNQSSGILFIKSEKMYVPEGGKGLGDQTNGIGHIHLFTDDLYLAGDGAIGIEGNNSSASIVAQIGHILAIDSAANTIAINAPGNNELITVLTNEIIAGTGIFLSGNSAEVFVTTNRLEADTAYDVSAGTLYLSTLKLTGAQTVTGGSVQLGPVTS